MFTTAIQNKIATAVLYTERKAPDADEAVIPSGPLAKTGLKKSAAKPKAPSASSASSAKGASSSKRDSKGESKALQPPAQSEKYEKFSLPLPSESDAGRIRLSYNVNE